MHPGPRPFTACGMRRSRRETLFCYWERQRERSSFAQMPSATVGRLGAPISTGTVCTRWPTIPAEANTEYGPQRLVIGEPCFDRAMILGRAGPIPNRRPFDFLPTPAFP